MVEKNIAARVKKDNYKCEGLCSNCLYVKVKKSPKGCNPVKYKKVIDSIIGKE